MKKQLLLLVVMLLPMVASAHDIAVQNPDGVIIYYNYTNNNTELAVTFRGTSSNSDYKSYSDRYTGNVVIPEEVTYMNRTRKVTSIGDHAFYGCSGLTSVTIPNSITNIGERVFINCSGLTSITIPNGVPSIRTQLFYGCTGLTSITIPNSVTSIDYMAFYGCSSLTSFSIPASVTSIGSEAFMNCSGLTFIVIPNSVTSIGERAFDGADIPTIFSLIEDPFTIYGKTSYNKTFSPNTFINASLCVPSGAINKYEAAEGWKDFVYFEEITSEDIRIGDLGISTFCGSNPIDLSGTEDVKAYVVSSYESATGQVTLTRTYYVPPFTGVVVKGNKGVYTIPAGVGQPVFPNMMKGVTTNTNLNKVNGDYTNYVLANKGGNLGFYAVADGSTLGAGKAYLPLPTDDLPSAAREFTLFFDDGETTEIMKVASQEKAPQGYYDLQGRRVANPTSGLYIVNGKKVIIK